MLPHHKQNRKDVPLDHFVWLTGEKYDFPSTGDWTSQKSSKEQWTVCTVQTYMCAYQERVCVYIFFIYRRMNQSINYLVNRRKCLIITWRPSMHNVCKKQVMHLKKKKSLWLYKDKNFKVLFCFSHFGSTDKYKETFNRVFQIKEFLKSNYDVNK